MSEFKSFLESLFLFFCVAVFLTIGTATLIFPTLIKYTVGVPLFLLKLLTVHTGIL